MSGNTLRISVPTGIRWDAEIQKAVHESLPYFAEGFRKATFGQDFLDLELDLPPPAELLPEIEALIRKTSRNFRDVHDNLLATSKGAPKLAKADPFLALIETGSVVSTGIGKFNYAGDFLRVFNGLDRVLEEYCLKQGAAPELYPSTVQFQTLLASGYLKLSPQLAYFVAPAHLDRQAIAALAESTVLDPLHRMETVEQLGIPDQVLAPTVCYHCFEARRDRSIDHGLITSLNKCHRHEVVNVTSLQRLTTYWMRELIVFGTQDQVQTLLDDALRFSSELFDRWDIWHEVRAANDPFFADLGAGNRIFQSAFQLKRELRLPNCDSSSMAVASFNNHQTSLVGKLNISSKFWDSPLHSGCIGWGYERLIYGLYCQFGADLARWPGVVRTDLDL